MNFKPLFDRVVLKNISKQKKTNSGFIIPETVGDEPIEAKVVAVGNGDCFDGKKSEMAVEVDDHVLYNKYGKTINYCHARQNPDSRGRMICGHTLQAGERVVIVDDGVSTGQSVDRWIEETKKCVDINVVALVTVFARDDMPGGIGRHLLEEKYGMKVYSVISDQDIQKALEKGIVRR